MKKLLTMKHAFGFTETPIESGILISLTLILGFLTGWYVTILLAYFVAGLVCLCVKYQPPEAPHP